MRFCLACNSVPENWHICVNKGLTYLKTSLTFLAKPRWVGSGREFKRGEGGGHRPTSHPKGGRSVFGGWRVVLKSPKRETTVLPQTCLISQGVVLYWIWKKKPIWPVESATLGKVQAARYHEGGYFAYVVGNMKGDTGPCTSLKAVHNQLG